jgi:hypothetical protein
MKQKEKKITNTLQNLHQPMRDKKSLKKNA